MSYGPAAGSTTPESGKTKEAVMSARSGGAMALKFAVALETSLLSASVKLTISVWLP